MINILCCVCAGKTRPLAHDVFPVFDGPRVNEISRPTRECRAPRIITTTIIYFVVMTCLKKKKKKKNSQ